MGKILDRALETTTITGTGSIELSGAVTGYVALATAAGFLTGDLSGPWLEVNYQIEQRNEAGEPVDWEIGVGTLYKPTSGNPYITRDTIRSSSNGGAKVNFGSGTKTVWSAPQAADFNGNFRQASRVFTKSGSITSTEISGWFRNDFSVSSYGFDLSKTVLLLQASLSEDYDALQWRILPDSDEVRVYWANSPASAALHTWQFLEGFPLVHHLLVDFGVGSAGANTLTGSLGVTLNNFSRAIIFQNFSGNQFIPGDARLDQIKELKLSSNTQAQLACDLNDAGTVKLSLSVVEF